MKNLYRLYNESTGKYFDTLERKELRPKFKYHGIKLTVVNKVACHNHVFKVTVR